MKKKGLFKVQEAYNLINRRIWPSEDSGYKGYSPYDSGVVIGIAKHPNGFPATILQFPEDGELLLTTKEEFYKNFTLKKPSLRPEDRPRLAIDKPTSSFDFMKTISATPVPESEWHPDDVDIIHARLRELEEMGLSASVRRRPDGSLTILTYPETDLNGE